MRLILLPEMIRVRSCGGSKEICWSLSAVTWLELKSNSTNDLIESNFSGILCKPLLQRCQDTRTLGEEECPFESSEVKESMAFCNSRLPKR